MSSLKIVPGDITVSNQQVESFLATGFNFKTGLLSSLCFGEIVHLLSGF